MDESVYTRQADESSWVLTVVLVSITIALWGFTLVNIPDIHDIADIYVFMTFGAMCMAGLAYASSAISGHVVFPFGVYPFPPLKDIPIPIAVGAAFGYIYTFFSGEIANVAASAVRTFSVAAPFENLDPPILFGLYGVGVPISEEILFRATMLPLIIRICTVKIKNKVLQTVMIGVAIVIITLEWVIAHFYTFGGDAALLTSLFIFGIGLSIITVIFRTAGAAIAAHMVYNSVIVWNFINPPAELGNLILVFGVTLILLIASVSLLIKKRLR